MAPCAPCVGCPAPRQLQAQVLTWELPWGATNPWVLVGHVMAGGRLEVPPATGADTRAFSGLGGYVALMQRCWAQAPEARPSFDDVVVQLK